MGAGLDFRVLPFYWQTWWFRGGVTLLALFAVAWSVRYETRRRMQRRVEELEYERGIERERARIAQDIHDDIGSSLTRITMLSQSVRPGGGSTLSGHASARPHSRHGHRGDLHAR